MESGLDMRLDVLRSLHSTLRVVTAHPDALGRYDAVIVISPRPSSAQRRTAVQEVIADRIAERVPTLLVKVEIASHSTLLPEVDGADASRLVGPRAETLVLSSDAAPDAVARQIIASLRGLLEQTVRAPSTGAVPPAVSAQETVFSYGTIDEEAHLRLERIARIAKDGSGFSGAEVNLLEPTLDSVLPVAGAETRRPIARNDSLDSLALQRGGLVVMQDTWLDPEACTRGPARAGAVRFYAACPIRLSPTHDPVGTFSVRDSAPHGRDAFDVDLFQDLALLAEGEIVAAIQRSS